VSLLSVKSLRTVLGCRVSCPCYKHAQTSELLCVYAKRYKLHAGKANRRGRERRRRSTPERGRIAPGGRENAYNRERKKRGRTRGKKSIRRRPTYSHSRKKDCHYHEGRLPTGGRRKVGRGWGSKIDAVGGKEVRRKKGEGGRLAKDIGAELG